jgi:5-methylthioadenosine/S-adenosylhomocysteine deaminase
MTIIYTAKWIVPITSAPIADGALAVAEDRIVGIGNRLSVLERFSAAEIRELGHVALLPGFVNAHSHLELTAMRGFLDDQEHDFFGWLKKLTIARIGMTVEDLYVSAAWGACEALRAGITCLADASDSAATTMAALRDTGLRATVFQESFGPDPKLAEENLRTLKERLLELRKLESLLIRVGVSPHAPYTVSGPQLELIARLALSEGLPLMMHAAESSAEDMLLRRGAGSFANGLAKRGILWEPTGLSTIRYLGEHKILETRPLLAHCINVDNEDLELLKNSGATVAHCPRSNAKLGHQRAPLTKMLRAQIPVGLGTDSVASNNSCDVLAEARFAILSARNDAGEDAGPMVSAEKGLYLATAGGARSLGMEDQIGQLREGMLADFAAVSLSGNHQIPSYDPVSTLLFASSGHDVMLTVVNGKEVYANGRVTTVDENALRRAVSKIAERFSSAGVVDGQSSQRPNEMESETRASA